MLFKSNISIDYPQKGLFSEGSWDANLGWPKDLGSPETGKTPAFVRFFHMFYTTSSLKRCKNK